MKSRTNDILFQHLASIIALCLKILLHIQLFMTSTEILFFFFIGPKFLTLIVESEWNFKNWLDENWYILNNCIPHKIQTTDVFHTSTIDPFTFRLQKRQVQNRRLPFTAWAGVSQWAPGPTPSTYLSFSSVSEPNQWIPTITRKLTVGRCSVNLRTSSRLQPARFLSLLNTASQQTQQ